MWDKIKKADKELGLPEIPYPTTSPQELAVLKEAYISIDLTEEDRTLWGKRIYAFVTRRWDNDEDEMGTNADFPATPGVYLLYDEDDATEWAALWYWFGGDWAIEVYGDKKGDFNFEIIPMPDETGDGESIFERHEQAGIWIRLLDLRDRVVDISNHLLNWVVTKDLDKLLS